MDTDISTTLSSSAANEDFGKYIPLVRAILKADWEIAHEIISKDKDALTAVIDENGQPALHVAVGVADATPKNLLFLKNLLEYMTNLESLATLVDNSQCNPLHRAAIVGHTEAANMLVDINPHWLFCLDKDKALPIHRAVFNSQKTTFIDLLKACKQHIGLSKQDGYHSPFEGVTGAMLLTNVIVVGYLDSAYELVKDYPYLATTVDQRKLSALEALASKWDAYRSGKRYDFYQSFVYSYVPVKKDYICDTQKIQDIEKQVYSVHQRIYENFWELALLRVPHIKHIQEEKLEHKKAKRLLKLICEEVVKLDTSDVFRHYRGAFALAVKNDTCEAVKVIIEHFPGAIWKIAQDKLGNNLLHLAGKLAPIHKLNRVSGAAIQMQMELQWFEEVKNFIRPIDKERKNNNEETPMIMFMREHKSLRQDGEEWMKKTADACTITAALIITIVFAAAITVPGGDDNGKPIYDTKPSFIIFAVSDAISLFSSTTSLLLFLSILTARYRDEDFLYSLPKRLILGLATLFLSVTSMMVAFSATLYIMFGQGKAWILIPIAILTCLPIASFVTLQLPLLVDLISSTYGNGVFAKPSDQRRK